MRISRSLFGLHELTDTYLALILLEAELNAFHYTLIQLTKRYIGYHAKGLMLTLNCAVQLLPPLSCAVNASATD